MDLPTLQNIYIAGKKIIVRTGFDVPLDDDGNITDDSRIRASVPTIEYLLEHKAGQIIIITHIGRPKDREPQLQTDNLAQKLAELLRHPVRKMDSFAQAGLPSPEKAKIVMLENLRFNPFEKSNDPGERDEFGKQLAALADIYVNDSFSTCHRDHASMTSIPKFIPGCVGLSVEQEVSTIKKAMESPKRPFVSIIGGVKADKLTAVGNLLDRVDKILIAGALAFTLLQRFGKEVGKSKTDKEGLDDFKDLLAQIDGNHKVHLPRDAVLADKFEKDAELKISPIDSIDPDWMALDIGPQSVQEYITIIKEAKTIVWNGPIGVFEFDKFAQGTKDIAHALAQAKDNGATVIVGGGDSGAAVEKLGLKDRMTLVSSGGGASLKLFEGKRLVALDALNNRKK